MAPEGAVGQDLFELVPFLGEGIRQKLVQAMDSNEVVTLQLDYEGPEGRTVYVEATIASHTEQGGTTGAVLGLVDVTETKTLEVQLIQAEKLAMAGQMSAEIGHELNNYLTVISDHTELLLCDPALEARADLEVLGGKRAEGAALENASGGVRLRVWPRVTDPLGQVP